MKYRPFILSRDEVFALEENTLSQSRRAIKLNGFGISEYQDYDWRFLPDNSWCYKNCRNLTLIEKYCSYGSPGDKLWVKETLVRGKQRAYYASDLMPTLRLWPWPDKHTMPPASIPRRFSRYTLEITNIRVERIGNITLNDIQAEGCPEQLLDKYPSPEAWFIAKWDKRNTEWQYTWEQNPYVWVLEFKRVVS